MSVGKSCIRSYFVTPQCKHLNIMSDGMSSNGSNIQQYTPISKTDFDGWANRAAEKTKVDPRLNNKITQAWAWLWGNLGCVHVTNDKGSQLLAKIYINMDKCTHFV